MKNNTKIEIESLPSWHAFCTQELITEKQQDQFALYLHLLSEWNNKFNITAITDPHQIITDHFQDSLAIKHMLSLDTQVGIGDIGSGGGFPAIPLKICYPHIPFVLIEVNNKKVQFLQEIINKLALPAIEICSLDWRTFLRKTSYTLDLFLARASLQPEELIRVLKPTSPYKNALLAYWASHTWHPSAIVAPFIESQHPYTINNKQRKLIFLKS